MTTLRKSLIDRVYTASQPSERVHACNCIGPQNGQPLCPCQMRNVTVRDGRYVKITDLGPAPSAAGTKLRAPEIKENGE